MNFTCIVFCFYYITHCFLIHAPFKCYTVYNTCYPEKLISFLMLSTHTTLTHTHTHTCTHIHIHTHTHTDTHTRTHTCTHTHTHTWYDSVTLPHTYLLPKSYLVAIPNSNLHYSMLVSLSWQQLVVRLYVWIRKSTLTYDDGRWGLKEL